MWQKELQKYNELIWHREKNNTLKSEMLDNMNISVRMLCNLKRGKTVTVNGNYVPMHTDVYEGDIIKVSLPEESNEYQSQKMEIEVLYEDCDLIVVEKPFGMVVHPTRNYQDNTMLNGIKSYFEESGIKSKVRFVNRLDRDTSGILIVAKNAYAHSVLTKDTSMWDMYKKYIAVVEGKTDESGTINLPIMKSEDGIRRIVDEKGQNSVTHYKAVMRNEKASFIELELETGRTHQIRVHMSALGHPLYGDELYGGNTELINRQALHCIELGFYSPRLEKEIRVKTKLHDDITELMVKLGLSC